MANTYHLDVVLGRAGTCRRPLMPEQLTHRLSLSLDGTRRSLLHEDVTILSVLKGEEHQVHRLLQTHDESRHPGLCQCDGITLSDLVYPERNH